MLAGNRPIRQRSIAQSQAHRQGPSEIQNELQQHPSSYDHYRHAEQKSNRHPDNRKGDNFGMGEKEETQGDRLQRAIELRKTTQSELARLCGLKPPSISEIRTGKTKEISGPNLICICDKLMISPRWLLTGKGLMEGVQVNDQDELNILTAFRSASTTWKFVLHRVISLKVELQEAVAEAIQNVIAQAEGKTPRETDQIRFPEGDVRKRTNHRKTGR